MFFTENIELKCSVLTGEYVYIQAMSDPAFVNVWRGAFDATFSSYSVNRYADYLSGGMHRWRGGHDLFVDVPAAIRDRGLKEGIDQALHILLTDLPTKAGIPIPGLSKNGLGDFLVNQCGIPKGYLNISLVDGIASIFVVAESHADLLQAIVGDLQMSPMVFFDTFGEGVLELCGGVFMPPSVLKASMILSGLENIAAGVISTWKTITCYVSPFDFFGGFLMSAFIGGTLAYFLQRGKPTPELARSVVSMAMRAGMIGSLSAVSSFFGLGAILGLGAYSFGKHLAERQSQTGWQASEHTADLLIGEIEESFPGLGKFLDDGGHFAQEALDAGKTVDFGALDPFGELRGALDSMNAEVEAYLAAGVGLPSLSEKDAAVFRSLNQDFPGLANFLYAANLNVSDILGYDCDPSKASDELRAFLERGQSIDDEKWRDLEGYFRGLAPEQS